MTNKIVGKAGHIILSPRKYKGVGGGGGLMPRQVRTLQWKVWLKEVLTMAENDIKMATGRGGGEVSPRKSVVQSASQYDVTSRVSDFQNGK